MKRSTLIACIFLVVGLLAWYFYQDSGRRDVKVSVVSLDCEKSVQEVYLLVMNSGEKEFQGKLKVVIKNKESKEKVTVNQAMRLPIGGHEYRQDTVFISENRLIDPDCQNYEIEAKIK